MKRLAAGLVSIAAVTMALGAAGAEAADTCSNAAYRNGPGAKLPDCRAWEQVTPVEKRGYLADPEAFIFPGPDGDQVFFNEKGGVAEADGMPAVAAFSSVRGSAWSTFGLDPPIDVLPNTFLTIQGVRGISNDRSKVLVVSLRKLTPDAVQGASNAYVRDARTGAFTLLATSSGTELYRAATTDAGGSQFFYGGSRDFESVGIATSLALTPDTPASIPFNLFVFRRGSVSLASRDVDGTPLFATPTDGYQPYRISEDQRRVTFNASRDDGSMGLFQRVDGASSVLISRSHRDGESKTAAVDSGPGSATPDGATVTFATRAVGLLTNDDQPSALYRWSASGDKLENLLTGISVPWSAKASAFTLVRVSTDQRYVWFRFNDADANDVPSTYFALLDTATRRLVIKGRSGPGSDSDPFNGGDAPRFSADGTKLVVSTPVNLTGYDQSAPNCPVTLAGRCREAFLYDAERPDAAPVCISCGAAGTETKGSVGLAEAFPKFGSPEVPDVVTNDGRVVFDTPQRLAPGDVNALADVYEYDADRGVTVCQGSVVKIF